MKPDPSATPDLSGDLTARLFSNMVMQYASMALMFMGKAPHPETNETVKDLDAAQMFISQLEMLQVKTKGNLTPDEEAILKQSLMTTRLAFVETIEQEEKATSPPTGTSSTAPSTDAVPPGPPEPNAAAVEAEERKKFVKKY